MGNRAVITFEKTDSAPCIYLHWNGGRDSVTAFMAVAKGLKIDGDNDAQRLDRLAGVLAKYFFNVEVNQRNIYREKYGEADTDNYDNGVYIIDRDWNIVGRDFRRAPEQREYDSAEMAARIVSAIIEDALPEYAKNAEEERSV